MTIGKRITAALGVLATTAVLSLTGTATAALGLSGGISFDNNANSGGMNFSTDAAIGTQNSNINFRYSNRLGGVL
ncbi:hypothetical protein ALI144C_00300 [Actinosynnema sp. ALI-1.44]|uniref:hypothetical protein n=1 Tax=Actinosynnema sp. ALI-1.44 TaxID=1933779 RepID=UPI00097BC09F|nr:hypothetical protein [Actinosynnema sp. ALI-1.44]ONI91966.1 hypothetical protein ALI144C_00300 [Actinosynnema sp. ALI-1.44]